MLTPLFGFTVLTAAYFVTRSQFGADSVVATGLRIFVVGVATVPIAMVAAAAFTDFGHKGGEGVVFGALIAGTLAGAANLPGFRRLMTTRLGQKTAAGPATSIGHATPPAHSPQTAPPVYPQQGHQPQQTSPSYPQQGHPPQMPPSYPQQGHPQQGHPQQGHTRS